MANNLDDRHKATNVTVIILGMLSIVLAIVSAYMATQNKHLLLYRIVAGFWFISFVVSLFIVMLMVSFDSKTYCT